MKKRSRLSGARYIRHTLVGKEIRSEDLPVADEKAHWIFGAGRATAGVGGYNASGVP
ncbi:MAG: hypothetical protein AAF943_04275 [Pseudomonadota bacterium]